jgi:hypothetical protein
VDVFDHQEKRLFPADRSNQIARGRPLAAVARGIVHGVVHSAQGRRLWQIQEIVEVDPLLVPRQALSESSIHRCPSRGRIAAVRSSEQAAHQGAQRVVAGTGAKVEDQSNVAGEAGTCGRSLELFDNAGLADAGLASDYDSLPRTGVPACRQHLLESGQLRMPADKRWALTCSFLEAGQAPGLDRLGQALDRQRTRPGAGETRRQHAAHRIRNQNRPARRSVGQARGEIHRIPGHGVLPVGRAPGAAGNDLTGGDADVHGDRAAEVGAERRHRVLDRERGAGGPLGIVAVGDRRPEHRHHAIADVLVDGSAESFDQIVDPFEEPLQQSMNLLGVELAAQFRIADQVAEQHRHLTSLAVCSGTCRRRGCSPGGVSLRQFRDGFQQLLAMTERDAKLIEIGIAKLGQDVGIDVVGAEGLLVALESEPAQPIG